MPQGLAMPSSRVVALWRNAASGRSPVTLVFFAQEIELGQFGLAVGGHGRAPCMNGNERAKCGAPLVMKTS